LDKTVPGENPGIVILGPTASGKSRLAIALALQFQGEIVSCDALQVYRHMDIGTAKIPLSQQRGIPHHLLDIREPGEDFAAGDYQRLARDTIREIRARGRLPFVVGGTGFYLRALIDGLFNGPARSENLRIRMRRIIARKGPGFLHRALRRIDAPSADKIAETDAERIIRAFEVYLLSGKTMNWWQQQPRDSFRDFRWLKIGIDMPREQLYRRINRRVEEMFQDGLLEEVQFLMTKYSRTSHAFKAIGYRQAMQCLDGRYTREQAVEETQKESRRYAKRQLTWFRSDPEIAWLDGRLDSDTLQMEAAGLITPFIR
jgi:tRNA dimethylallyltransferase